MQIPVLNGIYTDGVSDFRTSYPRNLIPVPKQQGISEGYLRPADGIIQSGTGPGPDRGGINWNGVCYRVMGTKLCSIDSTGAITILGDVGGSGQVTIDYSFGKLAIASGGNFYLWDTSTLTQVTDIDLGAVVDFIWVDGYFMTTDGVNLVVTELTDPTSVNPLKYGSSESDPDPVKGLIKIRNEPHALNRYTIEAYQNIGGDFFPFQRIEGALIMRGVVGTYAAAVFLEQIAFVGGGRNEAPAVWIGLNGSTQKISTREIDQILSTYTEAQLSALVVEVRVVSGHQLLYIHLPDRCLVYDGAGSQATGTPVWFTLDSSLIGYSTYRARNFVWCYDKWLCGDPTSFAHGYLTNTVSSHYGDLNGWDFGTIITYNEGRGALFHELELVCLTGRVALGASPTIWTSYSVDGMTWSTERPRTAGMIGQRVKRITWLQQGHMRHWRCQKFRGTSDSHLSIARLEAFVEPLNV
jgi:hypothetical protein